MGGKAVFFVTGLDSGGLENYLLRFLQYKSTSFSVIHVFCKGGKGGQLESDYCEIPNVTIVKRKIGYINPVDLSFLKRYLKENQFDAVCDFTGNFAGLVLWAAKRAKIVRRLVFYRGADDHFNKNFLKVLYNDFVNKLTLHCSTHLLSNSEAAFKYFFPAIWENNEKFSVIYNGIDASRFLVNNGDLREILEIPQKAFVIGHIGRFNKAKNHKTILEVAKRLVAQYDDIYFILCGNGVKDNLNPYLVENKITSRIIVFENRKDIPLFLNTMDCFFFPSITEGQPNALIEAMISGLPFVASNIGPIRETVGERYFSFLADPNDVLVFTQMLTKLYLEHPNKDKDLASEMIAKFDSEKLFTEFFNQLT